MVRRLLCLVSIVLAVGVAGGIASAELLAYYDFTDAGGLPTTANEGTVGTAADGVLMNGATIVDLDPDARYVEHVLKLDYGDGSVHQFMDIGGGTSTGWANWNGLAGHLQPMTIAAWICVTPGTVGDWRTIMSHGYESSWNLSTGTPGGAGEDQIAFSAHRGVAAWSPITGSVNVRDGYWHHVAGVVESEASAKLYIDGIYQGSKSCWQGVNYEATDVWIGNDAIQAGLGYDFSWNGMMDNVAIYNHALSESEVQDISWRYCVWVPPELLSLEITGPEQVAESSQAQYTATAWIRMFYNCFFSTVPVDVTTDAIWWVEPGTYASIDGSGLLTTGNIDTSENITIHAQYTFDVTAETEKAVDLCCSGDLNDDGKIDLDDYAILARQWLEAPGVPSADIAPFCSGDGIVDINDLGLLVDDWLWEQP